MLKLFDILLETLKDDKVNVGVHFEDRLFQRGSHSTLPVVISHYQFPQQKVPFCDMVGTYVITDTQKQIIENKLKSIKTLKFKPDTSLSILLYDFNLNENIDEINFYGDVFRKDAMKIWNSSKRHHFYLTDYNKKEDPSKRIRDSADCITMIVRGNDAKTLMFARYNDFLTGEQQRVKNIVKNVDELFKKKCPYVEKNP